MRDDEVRVLVGVGCRVRLCGVVGQGTVGTASEEEYVDSTLKEVVALGGVAGTIVNVLTGLFGSVVRCSSWSSSRKFRDTSCETQPCMNVAIETSITSRILQST